MAPKPMSEAGPSAGGSPLPAPGLGAERPSRPARLRRHGAVAAPHTTVGGGPPGAEPGRNRDASGWWRREPLAGPPQPLLRPGPRTTMYLPLAVLIAVLPGLFGLRHWDLIPPAPWWGLRGLAVLEGLRLDQSPLSDVGPESEARAYRAVAMQPPLYAWLEAAALAVSPERAPVATVLPSYLAGVAVVLLVYAHGRLWRGPALGLIAALLTGFNRDLLKQMQQATPTTLCLAFTLAALYLYAHSTRAEAGEPTFRRWTRAALAGGCLGLALLSVGLVSLLIGPIILLHRGLMGPDPWPVPAAERSMRRWRAAGRLGLSLALGLAVALLIALPWHTFMAGRHGAAFSASLLAPLYSGSEGHRGLTARLAMLAPATLPLALLALARGCRRVLTHDRDDPPTVGAALWLAWFVVAAITPAFLPAGPKPVLDLVLLVPLNLLAAQAVLDLAGRRIAVRAITWLAPLTALSLAWWGSEPLRQAVHDLVHGQTPDAARLWSLHIGLDLLVVFALAARGLDRWARRRDDRRRLILGGFLTSVLAMTVALGVHEIQFRHRETTDLLALRTAILRRQAVRPFHLLAVVGPPADPVWSVDDATAPRPGGRLRFLLRATVPGLVQHDLRSLAELAALPEGRRLVILAGSEQRLPYDLQARLGLEAIHPGRLGVLDAYATAAEGERSTRR